MNRESQSIMTIIKNETQRLNLNAAQIWVAFPVLVVFSRACSSCHICFSAVYKYAQYCKGPSRIMLLAWITNILHYCLHRWIDKFTTWAILPFMYVLQVMNLFFYCLDKKILSRWNKPYHIMKIGIKLNNSMSETPITKISNTFRILPWLWPWSYWLTLIFIWYIIVHNSLYNIKLHTVLKYIIKILTLIHLWDMCKKDN